MQRNVSKKLINTREIKAGKYAVKRKNIRLKKTKSFLEKRIFARGTKLGGFIALKGMRQIRKYDIINL